MVQAERRTLEEFLTRRHRDIVARVRGRAQVRAWPSVTGRDDEHGASVFLAQLVEALRVARRWDAAPSPVLALTAATHAAELRAAGCSVAEVVHHYGDICQTITEMSIEQHIPLTAADYQCLHRCVHLAIAAAVTEYARVSTLQRDVDQADRLGQAAHEMRDRLTTAMLAYETLTQGGTPADDPARAVLGRSLVRLRDVLDGPLAQLRLSSGPARHERLGVTAFIEDIASTAHLQASHKGIRLTVEPVPAALAMNGDSQLLTSALMSVLNNAFEFTPRGGAVVLRAYAEDDRVTIEVEDQCGGIRTARARAHSGAERRAGSRAGAGFGLSIARRALRAHHGEVTVRNLRGHGCIFALRLPLADASGPSPTSGA